MENQIRQIRLGLKDTGVLRMIKERPALIDVLFPRASAQIIEPEVLLHLNHIPFHPGIALCGLNRELIQYVLDKSWLGNLVNLICHH